MAKELTGGKTEIRLLRESYGITVTELCKEMGIQNGLYSSHECGHRRYSPEKYENFYSRVARSLETIRKRRIHESQIVKSRVEIVINDDGEEEEVEELVYQPITSAIYEKALHLIAVGKSLVWVSVKLEIDEIELERKLEKDGFTKGKFGIYDISL